MACCGIVQEFPCKLQRESRILNFSFRDELPPGVIITGLRPVIVEMLACKDDDPYSIMKGPIGLSEDGKVAQFPVDDGVKGATYQFTVEVERSGGEEPAMIVAYMGVV